MWIHQLSVQCGNYVITPNDKCSIVLNDIKKDIKSYRGHPKDKDFFKESNVYTHTPCLYMVSSLTTFRNHEIQSPIAVMEKPKPRREDSPTVTYQRQNCVCNPGL